MILVLIPFWTSILVRSYAWMVLLGQGGDHQRGTAGHAGLRTEPMQLLNTRMAVYAGHDPHPLAVHDPAPLRGHARHRPQPAAGGRESRRGARGRFSGAIFLPLSLPGVAAGCLLVFILALGFYITPALLGGQRTS